MSAESPRRLGRGLEALISTAKQQREHAAAETAPSGLPTSELQTIRVADIAPNQFQPRRTFSEPELAELEASIRASGLLQPITVRAKRSGGSWELVAGERRLRAATRIGWTEIPAIVRDFDDQAMLTLALVENLQRADLNAFEEAEGYQRLLGEFALTQQQVADVVGKDRTTITNLLRILTLSQSVRLMVEQGHLTAGHARALLVVKDQRKQLELANEIVAHHLSVREAEFRARQLTTRSSSPRPNKSTKAPESVTSTNSDPAVRRVEELLRRRLQTDVAIQQTGNERGVVRVSFYSHDDLERVLDLIVGKNRSDFD